MHCGCAVKEADSVVTGIRKARPYGESRPYRRVRGELKKGQLDLADHYGRRAGADKLALTDWTNDRIGPPLLREGLAWFKCQVVSEHPVGDHVLVVGRVIDGRLVDLEAEPMCYRETGGMDGASTLYPDVFGEIC